MNFLLKTLFVTVLIFNNRFTQNYASLLKPAYFGFAGIFFYYLISKLNMLTINPKDSIPVIILFVNAILLLVSGFYNLIDLEIIIYGIFPYIYLLLIYLLFHNRNIKDSQSVIFFTENLIFLNAVVCFFNGLYLLLRLGHWQDLVTGIHPFGTANELGYVFLIGILINHFYKKKNYRWKILLYIMTLFLMEAKGAILLLFIAVIIIEFETVLKFKDSIITVIAVLIIGYAMFYFINKQSHSIKFKTDIVNAFKYESSYQSTASAARIAHLIYVKKNYFRQHNLSPWFGSGIGTYESPAGYFFHSKYLALKNSIFWNRGQNTAQVTHTQIATLLAEGGYLGLVCFELGLITFLISFKGARHRFSLALLFVYFIAQIFHYVFLTFLTFIVFWPVLFTLLKEERVKIDEKI